MELSRFFAENPAVALAYSGGVDSGFLLYAAVQAGCRVTAYYVKSPFQPEFEYNDACRLAKELGAEMKVIFLDVLSNLCIARNPENRCYHCKKAIMTAILEQAKKDGYSLLIDGTNASDDSADRPGMAALAELSVRSPLREAGLTKSEIRRLSKEAGLFTWDKPAYACLATRIPTGTAIIKELLEKTEKAESYLMTLGFRDFRLRQTGVLQVTKDQLPLAKSLWEEITTKLKQDYPVLTLEERYGS